MKTLFHLLDTCIVPPKRFTYPFNYTPHPLCIQAAEEVQEYVKSRDAWKEEVDNGKMFGVLVVRDEHQQLGFLAAYSGLLDGKNDWEYFVPSVFDCIQPDGYFKIHEREISRVNEEIKRLEQDDELRCRKEALAETKQQAETEINDYKEQMRQSKQKRDKARADSILTPEQEKSFERESQFQKAELRRIKKRWTENIEVAASALEEKEEEIRMLKRQRKDMSDCLQQWLFSQYNMHNARGETRKLTEIFKATPQGVPPSGAGDCCAPKLLQYAYLNNMTPICMAEFWWGRSPKTEIRHHLHYYPACRSKCKPILGFMMQGLDVDPDPHDCDNDNEELKVVYVDDYIIVVSKPSGMLSMPGLINRRCVADVLEEQFGSGYYMPAHRLDMDTSGLLVVARSENVLRNLHEQFAGRNVRKRYGAVLDGMADVQKHGFIRLPLSPDQNDRPRQIVDYANGKPAVTEYEIERTEKGKTYIKLFPHTGRTHQLRVHCAHADGLALPIVGDPLYGHPSDSRLMLHAEHIVFRHPVTGKKLVFTEELW